MLSSSPSSGSSPVSSIPVSEYERYNRELEQYFSNYERYLDRLVDFATQPQRTLILHLEVRNIGGAPAEDVDVYVHFPNGFTLFAKDKVPGEPKEPKPPEKPLTSTQRMLSQANKMFGRDMLIKHSSSVGIWGQR